MRSIIRSPLPSSSLRLLLRVDVPVLAISFVSSHRVSSSLIWITLPSVVVSSAILCDRAMVSLPFLTCAISCRTFSSLLLSQNVMSSLTCNFLRSMLSSTIVIASPSGHPADLFGTAVDGVWRSHLVLGFVLRSLMCLLFCAFVMMCELACFVVSIVFRHVVPLSLYFLFFFAFAHLFVSR